jgi:hypothetical protein
MRKIFIYIIAIIIITGCNKLSGTYKSEKYAIRFANSEECIWYQDGMFFEGKYRKVNDKYEIAIKGQSFYPNTIFMAVKDGEDLIITGGIIKQKRFKKLKKQTKK